MTKEDLSIEEVSTDTGTPQSERTPLSISATSFIPSDGNAWNCCHEDGLWCASDDWFGCSADDGWIGVWCDDAGWPLLPPCMDDSIWATSTWQGHGEGNQKRRQSRQTWRKDEPRDVQVSKVLAQILRHTAVKLGLEMGDDGFCELDELLRVRPVADLKVKVEEIETTCNDKEKRRFELKMAPDGKRYIRAAQGHSVKVVDDEKLLRRLGPTDNDLPKYCIHGTYRKHLDSIYASGGLTVGGCYGEGQRNHVHFVPRKPGDNPELSGMRHDCDIAISIDLKRALKDGVPFYISGNDVLLSPGVDGMVALKYFKTVTDLPSNQSHRQEQPGGKRGKKGRRDKRESHAW